MPNWDDYMEKSEFKTFNKYWNSKITASMEDYIEMIFRLSVNNGYTRIQELADNLNVSSPSTTKMMQKLANLGYLKYHKYGIIVLEEKGKRLGHKLLLRHNVVSELLSVIGVSKECILSETEKVEHTLSDETIK